MQCWCWCMLELWRNCLVLAGAGAGGEISGNGTMAGQAARQLSSARPLPRWLKVSPGPHSTTTSGSLPAPTRAQQPPPVRQPEERNSAACAVMVVVGPTHLHHAIMWRPCTTTHRLHMGTIATTQHITIQYLICMSLKYAIQTEFA